MELVDQGSLDDFIKQLCAVFAHETGQLEAAQKSLAKPDYTALLPLLAPSPARSR